MRYFDKRTLVVDTIIELTKKLMPDSLDSVVDLTNAFCLSCENFASTIDGMLGFINWAKENDQPNMSVLETLIHDAVEFKRNRYESWYSPRTSGYEKYLTNEQKT